MVQLNVLLLTALVGSVIPLLVGFITKTSASRNVKSIVGLALSAIATGITFALATDGTVVLSEWIVGILMTFGTGLAAHYNILKPSGLTALVHGLVPNVGIGRPQDPLAQILAALNKIPDADISFREATPGERALFDAVVEPGTAGLMIPFDEPQRPGPPLWPPSDRPVA